MLKKIHGEELIELKGETDEHNIIVGDFNTTVPGRKSVRIQLN